MTWRPTAPARAALWVGCLLFADVGCAQSVDTVGGSGGTGATTTSSGGSGGSGGTTITTVPETCTAAEECAALETECTEGDCEDGECVAKPANDFAPCDDDDACTDNDQCGQGQCAGAPKSCGAATPCFIAACNPSTGGCEETPGDEGGQCDDGDPCTYFGTCKSGVCAKGKQVDCSFLDGACTTGVCDLSAGCKSLPTNEAGPCDDGFFCTSKDSCQGGVCVGGPPTACAPPGGCFIGTCDELTNSCTSVPGNDGVACDDGSPCTTGTTCSAGACLGGQPANNGMACDDGTSCTTGETCTNGTCGGGTGPEVYFSEDFSDNSAGWVLGQEWEIGPAEQGFSNGFGNLDPESDHTSTFDDGIAGVVIGGDASVTPHPYSFLESPTFNTAGATGDVILGYYRWLNSEGHPVMHNRVDVYNGSQWITVWASGDYFSDFSWSFVEHDLTNYKNAAMRIRFGFDMGQFGFFPYTSWNIDDVLVASQACP